MKTLILIILCCTVGLSFTSKKDYICTSKECHNFMTKQQNRIFYTYNRDTAEANNDFSTSFHRYLIKKDPNMNTFYSPFSILTAFGLLLCGAKGETRNELEKAFKWDSLKYDPAILMAILTRQIQNQNGHNKLDIANKVWLDKHEKPLQSFLKKLNRYYDSKVGQADFISKPDIERNDINSWVSNHTNGMIPNLLPRGSITHQTKMVLVNAMHFQASWMDSFKEEDTELRTFTLENGKTIRLPMMVQISNFYHGFDDELDCEILRVPYEKETYSMYIVLPNYNTKLQSIENHFNQKTIDHWQKNMKLRKLTFLLPRFSMSSDLNIKNILQDMGLQTTFSTKADFSGITADKNIFVDDALHKAAIAVNEKGIKASTATAISRGRSFSRLFAVNKPFFFYITEITTGSIMFTGRVKDPTKL